MLKPGSLQVLLFQTLCGPPKDKYCILVCVDPKPMFFLVSTELSRMKQEQPELLECQVIIDAESNDLKYDSYIDCTDPYGYDLEDAQRQISKEGWRDKGMISPEVLAEVIRAVEKSPTLQTKKRNFMLAALNNITF